MAKRTFLVTLRETVSKLRPYIAAAFIVAFSIAPLIQYQAYRVSIAASFGVVLLYLFFDIYRELIQRLENIEKNLKEPNPPQYADFNVALPVIKGILIERLKANDLVKIRILAVSAQFSWKSLIDTTIPQLFNIGKKQKIEIEIVIVKPSVLHNWGQKQLENDAQSTLLGEDTFKKVYKSAFSEGKISLNIYQYDNIPHWHGILIDDDILFMGRCKWKVIDGKYHLAVGQIDYRQFRLNDRFGGATRIELVDNWFETYKFRAQKIKYLNSREENKI